MNLSEDRTPAGAMETGLATAGDPICRVIQIFREKPWSSSMAVDGDGVKAPRSGSENWRRRRGITETGVGKRV